MKNLFLVYCLIFVSLAGKSQAKNFIDQPYIEVVGTADSLITPDEIFIKIIISENDNKGKVSLDVLEHNMIEAFKKIGINTEADLTVEDMASNFKFYLLKRTDVFKTKEYNLKVTNAKMAAGVFNELQNLNISNATIERVSHTHLEEINNRVRSKAVENARNKAIALTSPINQGIGAAIQIVENAEMGNLLEGKVAGISIRGYSAVKQVEPDYANIDFEKMKISSSVDVKFILK